MVSGNVGATRLNNGVETPLFHKHWTEDDLLSYSIRADVFARAAQAHLFHPICYPLCSCGARPDQVLGGGLEERAWWVDHLMTEAVLG